MKFELGDGPDSMAKAWFFITLFGFIAYAVAVAVFVL